MSTGPPPIPDNSPLLKPRGINSFNSFLTTVQRDVPKQLERSRRMRAALRRGSR